MDLLITYLKTLFDYAKAKAALSLLLMVFLGLTQGIGLLLIIPFLGVIGIGGGSGMQNHQIAEYTKAVFQIFGLTPDIYGILFIYVIIISLHAGIKRFHEILNTRIIHGYTQFLRNRLYSRLCRLNWLGFLRTKQADITHVLTADLQNLSFATQQLFQLIGSVFIVCIQLGVAFMISFPMTLAALGCGGVFMLLLNSFHRQALRFGNFLREGMNNMFSAVTEHIGGMKIAKSYGLEPQLTHHFQDITDAITRQMIDFSKINTATRMIYQIGTALAVALFLLVGIKLLEVPAIDLMVVVFLFTRLLPGFSGLQQNVQRILNAMPSFTAIHQMERDFKAAAEPRPSREGDAVHVVLLALKREIRFDHVYFRYGKTAEDWALEDIHIKIPANAITALTGGLRGR